MKSLKMSYIIGLIGVAISLLRNWEFKSKFVIFYFRWCFEMTHQKCCYMDNRSAINLGFIFFKLTLISPFRNESLFVFDEPTHGIMIHHDTFWIYRGKKRWITWYLPFFTREWIRTSVYLKNSTWAHEITKDKKNFWEDGWRNQIQLWNCEYNDAFDKEKVNATISLYEREWRPKWLTWTGLFKTISRKIEVEFDKEVGKEKGSYKGGAIGCSYEILKGETPIECLKRMEKERKF